MAKPGGNKHDDSDLEDLLTKGGDSGDKNMETTPLNLDHLTKGQLDVPRRSAPSPGLLTVISAHCSFLCYAYPRICGCFSFLVVGLIMFLFINALINPTATFGKIEADFTTITSEYDMTMGKIDHWCLRGDNDSCRCEDPLEPTARGEYRTWTQAHIINKKLVKSYEGSSYLDVAFLGESLVEEMDGRWMGRPQGEALRGVERVFQKHFNKTKSGMQGVALGIAGDTCPNVLWRLLHGEMPDDFNPRVWWISLGMNDLGRMQCSEEVVVLGILRVVEEILHKKPEARVVINSMLPMADLRGGLYPQRVDYKDAFRPGRGRPVNPTMVSRNPAFQNGGVVAGPGKTVPVTYHRPETTTAMLDKHYRYKGGPGYINRPGAIPGGKYPGGLTPKDAAKLRGSLARSGNNDRILRELKKKKEKEDKKKKKEEEKEDKKKKKQEEKKEKEDKKKEDKKKKQEKKEKKREKKEKRGKRKKREKEEENNEESDEGPMTKREKKMAKKYLKKIRKDPVNPRLDATRTKIKRRDPKAMFLKANRLPLWTSIYSINEELRKFCEKQKRVSFFDATEIFTEREEGKRYMLKSELISIRGHPTEQGFREWEGKIAEKLKKMFEKQDEELAEEAKEEQQEQGAGQDSGTRDTTPKDITPKGSTPDDSTPDDSTPEGSGSKESKPDDDED